MKKIAITGHPSSNYLDLENLFVQNGIASANPSRKEKLSIHEIQKILLKESAASCLDEVSEESSLEQVKPNGIWNELVFDFLLGNANQDKAWCWASSESLQLSEMWLSADKNIYFIVVYNHPVDALVNALVSNEKKSLSEVLNDWYRYYNSALKFCLENDERCLLIHQESAVGTPSIFNEYLGVKLTHSEKDKRQDACSTIIGADGINKIKLGSEVPAFNSEKFLKSHYLEWMLKYFVVSDKTLVLYEQLIASDDALDKSQKNIDLQKDIVWDELKKHIEKINENESEANKLVASYESLQEENKKEGIKSSIIIEQLEEVQKENEELKKEILKQKKLLNTEVKASPVEKNNENELNRLRDENSLLLTQLEITQNALDHNSKGQTRKEKIEVPVYGAADRIKKQLTYRLGAVVVQANTIIDYIMLPARLKREHKEFKKEQKNKVKLPAISLYVDAHEAEKVKGHLSYRLGLIIMKESQSISGLIALPFKLKKEAKKFHSEKLDNKNRL